MKDTAGPATFNFGDSGADNRETAARKLAEKMTSLKITDRLGSAAGWVAVKNPRTCNDFLLMAHIEYLETAKEIAQSVFLSQLVKSDQDIMLYTDPASKDDPRKRHCMIVIEPDRINRTILDGLLAGRKPAPVNHEGFTFN